MIIEKILLGVSLSAPIGPVSLEMIKRGLKDGFLSAFIIRLGGSIGNMLCLVAAYFGLGLMNQSPLLMSLCGLLGSVVLIYMGAKAFLDKRNHSFKHTENTGSETILNGLLTGFVLSIANPIGIVFWLSIFAASLSVEQVSTSSWFGLLENTTIILGVLLWGALLSSFLELGKRYFTDKIIHLVTLCAGLLLIGFGAKYGWLSIQTIIG
tara:strand:+ start:42845 stop:43471 length:627 start_codon:yes stop_codon:yes gene_type:complete